MGVYTHVRVCDHVILKNSYTQNQLSRCVVLLFKLSVSLSMTIEIVGLGGYKVGFIWYTFISPPDLCYSR